MAKSLLCVEDYRRAARRALPHMLYEYVAGGALSEATVRRNQQGFADVWFRSRALKSSPSIDTSRTVFGDTIAFPVMTAPTGASGLLWPGGELETARAAADAGTIMAVSAASIASMEEIAAAAPGPKWLQMFCYKDRGLTAEFLQRARAAGYRAVCITTDAPEGGRRERETRTGFTVDRGLTMTSIVDAALHVRWWMRMAGAPKVTLKNFEGRATGFANIASYISSVRNPGVAWDDVAWVRRNWNGPMVLKGVLHPDDAATAVERGVDGIQVSNHGGRQLDGCLATIDALPGVVDAVAGRVPVFLDGGVTRGTDAMKAIALGATAVLIGRAHLWGLAVAGRAGVADVLKILREDIRNSMTIGGWRSLDELDRDAVARLVTAEALRPAA